MTGAIVLAAGLGTRMKSGIAKVLHHLGGRPLIAYPLSALRGIGVDPIVVVVGYQAEAVRAACLSYGVRFAVQAEQRGTGDATVAARSVLGDFDGDLLLVNGDLPFLRPESLRDLVAAHRAANAPVSLLTATVDDPHGFGRVVRDEHGAVVRIVEERDATPAERAIREINVGVYCAASSFLFDALAGLEPTNAQAELYLTDIVALARAQGLTIASAAALGDEGIQISSRGDLAAREGELRARITSRWMDAGVTIEDPATAYIGPEVRIGRDTVIGPNVTLRGATAIGENCRLDGSAFLVDATLGNDVHVKFGVVMTEVRVEDNVAVGPFAHLRPGTHLGVGVHIGDFVETKNAVLGPGTKANHLAYLGDVRVGRDVNVGAGTITCNYDGFRKHQTVVGDRVQVGSDSQLVAPVTIGDDVYIATATTVRRDVPAGALVFNSREQVHRAGWVAARRARESGAAEQRGARVQAVRSKAAGPKSAAPGPKSKVRSRKPAGPKLEPRARSGGSRARGKRARARAAKSTGR
ncbi:bifunctional UDP-N-acetylglucosamine diphosphorylase/glucosamine-1-phosphate N-acetyltransferase GlmU [Candidatus Binatia bacterium]|nr:bifunctional UDP-N-acetylglucosamine diphosphorylase/glucosamine-1-phosphate N-acetyltransferase GlmU [Candidatus Binatia bacterium]